MPYSYLATRTQPSHFPRVWWLFLACPWMDKTIQTLAVVPPLPPLLSIDQATQTEDFPCQSGWQTTTTLPCPSVQLLYRRSQYLYRLQSFVRASVSAQTTETWLPFYTIKSPPTSRPSSATSKVGLYSASGKSAWDQDLQQSEAASCTFVPTTNACSTKQQLSKSEDTKKV